MISVNKPNSRGSGLGQMMNSGAGKIGQIGLAAYTGGASAAGMAALKQSNSPAGRAAGAYSSYSNMTGGSAQPGMENSNSSAYQGQLGADTQFQTDPSLNPPDSMLMPGQGNGQIMGNNDQLSAMMRRMQMANGYTQKGY